MAKTIKRRFFPAVESLENRWVPAGVAAPGLLPLVIPAFTPGVLPNQAPVITFIVFPSSTSIPGSPVSSPSNGGNGGITGVPGGVTGTPASNQQAGPGPTAPPSALSPTPSQNGNQGNTNQGNNNLTATPGSNNVSSPTGGVGVPGTPATIGLLAFPLIPGYPVGTQYYTPRATGPIPVSTPSRPDQLALDERQGWAENAGPIAQNPDEMLETPDQLTEEMWDADQNATPPADEPETPATPPPDAPDMQELGVNWLLPGGDVVSRTVAPAAVPATAVDEAFRQMFGAGNSTPGKEASLAGVVAAGLAGMIAPEFRRGDAGRQKGHPAAGKWNRRRKQ